MNNNKGFTLIEVMIVVVIVAILATVAFPAYQDTVRKSRRSEAKISLLQIAQIMERCFTEFNVYVGPPSQCPILTDTDADTFGDTFNNLTTNTAPLDGQGYYTISNTALTATTFDFTATPRSIGSQDKDIKCASFTLDQRGTKGAVDSSGTDTTSLCWQ